MISIDTNCSLSMAFSVLQSIDELDLSFLDEVDARVFNRFPTLPRLRISTSAVSA